MAFKKVKQESRRNKNSGKYSLKILVEKNAILTPSHQRKR